MMQPLLGLAALSLAACSVSGAGDDDGRPGVPAQGTGGTRTFAVSGFTGIDLRGADDVDVSVGPGFSVRADGDPAVLDRLKIEKVGDTLRIARIAGGGWQWSGHGAKVAVTLPALAQVAVAGSGNVTVDKVTGASFVGDGAGSGRIAVGQLAVDDAKFSLAGSGDVKLAGAVKRLSVSIAGSGDIEARQLTAAAADISIAGSGGVRTTVNGPAKVSVMGSGDVDLGPGAKCETSKMGSGSVRCGG